ncbi:MAG: hypothetical protein J6V59_02030 [Alistipes sp.]|nr:hypothetical protein [Alistipes sp.]
MRHIRDIIVSIVALLGTMAPAAATAQVPTLRGYFSQDSVEVGDVVEYVIEIEKDRATEIGIPDFDTSTPEQRRATAAAKRTMSTYEEYDEDIFELVEEMPFDTLAVEGRTLRLRKRYRLAVMETGTIPMRPAILYFDKNRETPDTLYAPDTLRLHVASYAELDTMLFLKADPTSQQGFGVDDDKATSMLKDEGITTQKDMPFIFAEISDYVTYGAIALIILALVAWAVVWIVARELKRRKSIVKPKPAIPPHIVAVKALEELANRKLWQNGKYKLYYSSLTSILKVYIVGRWGVGALEMTTDEIMVALQGIEMPNDSRANLIAILRTADMVKFAKAQPEAEENEENYTRAYYFVENTKLETTQHNETKREITFETKIEE